MRPFFAISNSLQNANPTPPFLLPSLLIPMLLLLLTNRLQAIVEEVTDERAPPTILFIDGET